jgi:hypothetical protein
LGNIECAQEWAGGSQEKEEEEEEERRGESGRGEREAARI